MKSEKHIVTSPQSAVSSRDTTKTRRLRLRFRLRFLFLNLSLNLILLLFTVYYSLFTAVHAEVLDRVVAIVDEEVILLSEFEEAFKKAQDFQKMITEEEVLSGMINRILLLREAKKFGMEYRSGNENTLIHEYIERRLKVFIRIPPEETELFYEKNKDSFGNKDLHDVRDEIETYLIEKELNKRLLEHIKELRRKAYIRIQLSP